MQLDIPAFDAAPLVTDPYPHVIVPGFLPPAALAEAVRDFPRLDMTGSFPPDVLDCRGAFAELIAWLEGDALRRAVERKFAIDLAGRPTLCTVRGMTDTRDGHIHRDAAFKLVTLLLYLNDDWAPDGGRLRVLRSADDLDDYAAEIPPNGGTLFAFLCTPAAWHGHRTFIGQRRTVQMNYVTDVRMVERELARHRLASRLKKVKRLIGLGRGRAA